jgi:hypothetical protein
MSDLERRMAVALRGCRFTPGSAPKRFARDIAELSDRDPKREFTPRQRGYLFLCCYRYRRQISRELFDAITGHLWFYPNILDGFRLPTPLAQFCEAAKNCDRSVPGPVVGYAKAQLTMEPLFIVEATAKPTR